VCQDPPIDQQEAEYGVNDRQRRQHLQTWLFFERVISITKKENRVKMKGATRKTLCCRRLVSSCPQEAKYRGLMTMEITFASSSNKQQRSDHPYYSQQRNALPVDERE
jgi:hypothetical protein